MHACIDSPSTAFTFNCNWSSSKSFELDIFLTIFSSSAKNYPLILCVQQVQLWHSPSNWPFFALGSRICLCKCTTSPSFSALCDEAHAISMHTLQVHMHNCWPFAGIAVAFAEFVGAVAEIVVAVLLFLTAVGQWVKKTNPIKHWSHHYIVHNTVCVCHWPVAAVCVCMPAPVLSGHQNQF